MATSKKIYSRRKYAYFKATRDVFLPNLWPTYYYKSKKIYVWDLNGKKYTDFIFAVGQSTLGYSNNIIDRAIKKKLIMET